MKKITIGLILSVMALAICPIYAECESGEENQPIYCTFDDNGEWICKDKNGNQVDPPEGLYGNNRGDH